MNMLAQSPLLAHLAWSLIHFLWQGAVVGLGYWWMRHWLRKAAPQSRYLLALSTLLVLILLPICTFLYLGGWQLHNASPDGAWPTRMLAITVNSTQTVLPVTPTRQAFPYLSWVVWLWLAGVAFMGARALWGWRQAAKLRLASTTSDHPWQALLCNLQEKMQISRAIELLESVRVQAPLVIGWLKPVILIPPSAVCGLDWRQAEMILAHELAHIRRHDYLFNLLQVMVETLLFYHPVVHWISKDARNEREFCCDDAVMKICGDRVAYLKALAELEEHRLRTSPAMAANGGVLWNRAHRLAYRIEPVGKLPTWSVALALLAALFVAGLLVHPRHAPAHTAMHASVVSQPIAVSRTRVSATRNLPIAVAYAAAPVHAVPTPTRIMPRVAKIQLAQSLGVSPFPQAMTPLAAVSLPKLAEIPVSAASGITVVAPHPLPQPEYPYVALRENLGGEVQVSFRVSTSGQVEDIRTKMISGPVVLASTTRAALENWQFNPVRVKGKTLTPRLNLEFVFSADPNTKPIGTCAMVTGSHVCHWYRISLQNVTLVKSDASSGQSEAPKLAVVENTKDTLCRPQDACFFSTSQPGREHEQRIQDQFRMLSQGFIPTGGAF